MAPRTPYGKGCVPTIFLALPAYNEAPALPAILEAFQQTMETSGYEGVVVVVDDGSNDGTEHVLQKWSSVLPIHAIRHEVNEGLGMTIQDGLRRAAELAQPDDVIVTMDADNTHAPTLIPEMVRLCSQGFDVVIASRYRRGSQVFGLNPLRRLLTFCARLLYRTAFPIRGVRDYTSGFRAYRALIIQRAFTDFPHEFVTQRSFVCMAEILVKLSGLNLKFAEVPMVLRYDRKPGPSKMNVYRTVLGSLALLAKSRRRVSRSIEAAPRWSDSHS